MIRGQIVRALPGYGNDADGTQDDYSRMDQVDMTIQKHTWIVVAVPPGCDIKLGARFAAEDLYYGVWTSGITFRNQRIGTERRFP